MTSTHSLTRQAATSAQTRTQTLVHHFRRPHERPFTAAERKRVTILFGGLTDRHNRLVEGCFERLGYRCRALPTPDLRALELGREYGSRGQCNPAHFNVGNLIKHLLGLREGGLPTERIIDEYVYLTAGACGPCRFGMYEAEYRLALANAGFQGFRVLLFQQKGGLSQGDLYAGLRLDADFFLSLVKSLMLGDLLNDLGHRIRPYEVVRGATDRALGECTEILYKSVREQPLWSLARKWPYHPKEPLRGAKRIEIPSKVLHQAISRHHLKALGACRRILARVEVDRTRVAPVVTVTGEFWAQLTEGDGNYRMLQFLESEGAEVRTEPIVSWLRYLCWQVRQGHRDRFGLRGHRNPFRYLARVLRLSAAEWLLAQQYERFRRHLGGTGQPLANHAELARLAHPYYHSRLQGGEGHLEVAHSIHHTRAKLCHMVLSLKPFGCMPSTQSDGVMAAVTAQVPKLDFLSLETSGEDQVGAHSRAQMALAEAKRMARDEVRRALDVSGLSIATVRAFVATHPEARSALYRSPRDPRFAATSASFVNHVASLMEKSC